MLPVLLSLLIAGPVRAESDTAGKSADISDRTALLQARREQLAQKRERQFRVADADHDRGLSRAELSASDMPRVLVRRFDEIDGNQDGELSRSEEHTSELQSLMRTSYDGFCCQKKQ